MKKVLKFLNLNYGGKKMEVQAREKRENNYDIGKW